MDGTLVLIPIIISLGFFATIAVIVVAGSIAKNRRARMQADVQTRLIDKFGSAPEFVTFLQTPAGQQLMSGVEAVPRMMARERIVAGFRRAIILTFIGLAFIALCYPDSTRNEGFMIAGAIMLALGVAFFLSAVASLKLGRSLGLVDPKDDPVIPPASTTHPSADLTVAD